MPAAIYYRNVTRYFCACGNKAVTRTGGDPVCARCKELEDQRRYEFEAEKKPEILQVTRIEAMWIQEPVNKRGFGTLDLLEMRLAAI